VREASDRDGVGIQLHLLETKKERDELEARYGQGIVSELDGAGVLGKDVLQLIAFGFRRKTCASSTGGG